MDWTSIIVALIAGAVAGGLPALLLYGRESRKADVNIASQYENILTKEIVRTQALKLRVIGLELEVKLINDRLDNFTKGVLILSRQLDEAGITAKWSPDG